MGAEERTSDDSFGSEESRASEPEPDDKWPKQEIASARARTAHNSHQRTNKYKI